MKSKQLCFTKTYKGPIWTSLRRSREWSSYEYIDTDKNLTGKPLEIKKLVCFCRQYNSKFHGTYKLDGFSITNYSQAKFVRITDVFWLLRVKEIPGWMLANLFSSWPSLFFICHKRQIQLSNSEKNFLSDNMYNLTDWTLKTSFLMLFFYFWQMKFMQWLTNVCRLPF